jgi:hypothetical protein
MKNFIVFLLVIFSSVAANAAMQCNYTTFGMQTIKHCRHYRLPLLPGDNDNGGISNTDGFVNCVALGDGAGGTCKVYSGYAVVAEGTYREVLQSLVPGAIYKGFTLEPSENAGQITVHIFFVRTN